MSQVPELRRKKGQRFGWSFLLTVIAAAVASDQRSAHAIERQLYSGDQFAALARFHAECDNLRAAMEWWVARDNAHGEDGLWFIGALRWFWYIQNL